MKFSVIPSEEKRTFLPTLIPFNKEAPMFKRSVTLFIIATVLFFGCSDIKTPTQPLTKPTITTQPQPRTVALGDSVSFSVVATGDPAPTYQWQWAPIDTDGRPVISSRKIITGATDAHYTITSVTSSDSGYYLVQVANSQDTIQSGMVKLTVHTPPVITTQPLSATVTQGDSVSFSVVAMGNPAPTYQWMKVAVKDSGLTPIDFPISGAINVHFSITAVKGSDSGFYYAAVTNSRGKVNSDTVKLTVRTPPVIISHPKSFIVTEGDSVIFLVDALGTPPLSYKWQKDGATITNATDPTFTFSGAALTDSGAYRVIVSNNIGSDTSSAAILRVNPAIMRPNITTGPMSETATVGDSVTFDVVSSGTRPFTYTWQRDGTTIDGADSTLTINTASLADAGEYRVIVINAAGSDTSAAAMLEVNPPMRVPVIVTQPLSETITVGGIVTFEVVASGTLPFIYVWQKDGATIDNATDSTLTINTTSLADAGDYRVIVSNKAGSDTSAVATLSVNPAVAKPVIISQPQSRTVTEGVSVTFSIAVGGTQPLAFQWQKNSVDIDSATDLTFTIVGAALADSGSYRVIVTNKAGSDTSAAATLTVHPAPAVPVIITQPQSRTVTAGVPVTFTVASTGTRPFSYRWQKNGGDITSATDSTFTIAAAALADSGAYRVIVTNTAGSDTSNEATLKVTPSGIKTTITMQPISAERNEGEFMMFEVSATGSVPIFYQWQKDGVDLSGANETSLNISPISLADSGTYRVIVSNDAGSDTSQDAHLTVHPISADSYEPTDNAATGATALTIGASGQTHTITPGDTDWFSFSAETDSLYIIQTTGHTDGFMTLYDTDGVTPLDNDNGNIERNPLITWTCLSSGTYYFTIRGFGAATTGAYSVTGAVNR